MKLYIQAAFLWLWSRIVDWLTGYHCQSREPRHCRQCTEHDICWRHGS